MLKKGMVENMKYGSCIALAILGQAQREGTDGIKILGYEGTKQVKEGYWTNDTYLRYIERFNRNSAYELKKNKERKEIIEKIDNGCEIKFYNGFIVVNGKTYNGWNAEQIESIKIENDQLKIKRKNNPMRMLKELMGEEE